MRSGNFLLELLPEIELFVPGQRRKFLNRAKTPISSLCHIPDRDVALFPVFFTVEPGGYRTNLKDTASRIAQCSPWTATGTCCIQAYRHWMYVPNASACLIKVRLGSGLICVQSPKAGGGGGPSPGALAMLAWGSLEEPHARGSRLDVHTKLFVYAAAVSM